MQALISIGMIQRRLRVHTHRHALNAHGCVHAPQGSRVLDRDHENVHDRGTCYRGYAK